LGAALCAERKDGPCQGSYPRVVVLHVVLGYILSKMFRRSISGMLAGLLIVAAVCMFVLMSRSVAVVAVAAFCLIAGVVWLCCELSDLRRGQ
jgi:dolichol kinase